MTKQFVVGGTPARDPLQTAVPAAFFDEDGTPVDVTGGGASLPPVATAEELEAGTVTEVRLVTPALLAAEIDRRIAAAAG